MAGSYANFNTSFYFKCVCCVTGWIMMCTFNDSTGKTETRGFLGFDGQSFQPNWQVPGLLKVPVPNNKVMND